MRKGLAALLFASGLSEEEIEPMIETVEDGCRDVSKSLEDFCEVDLLHSVAHLLEEEGRETEGVRRVMITLETHGKTPLFFVRQKAGKDWRVFCITDDFEVWRDTLQHDEHFPADQRRKMLELVVRAGNRFDPKDREWEPVTISRERV